MSIAPPSAAATPLAVGGDNTSSGRNDAAFVTPRRQADDKHHHRLHHKAGGGGGVREESAVHNDATPVVVRQRSKPSAAPAAAVVSGGDSTGQERREQHPPMMPRKRRPRTVAAAAASGSHARPHAGMDDAAFAAAAEAALALGCRIPSPRKTGENQPPQEPPASAGVPTGPPPPYSAHMTAAPPAAARQQHRDPEGRDMHPAPATANSLRPATAAAAAGGGGGATSVMHHAHHHRPQQHRPFDGAVLSQPPKAPARDAASATTTQALVLAAVGVQTAASAASALNEDRRPPAVTTSRGTACHQNVAHQGAQTDQAHAPTAGARNGAAPTAVRDAASGQDAHHVNDEGERNDQDASTVSDEPPHVEGGGEGDGVAATAALWQRSLNQNLEWLLSAHDDLNEYSKLQDAVITDLRSQLASVQEQIAADRAAAEKEFDLRLRAAVRRAWVQAELVGMEAGRRGAVVQWELDARRKLAAAAAAESEDWRAGFELV